MQVVDTSQSVGSVDWHGCRYRTHEMASRRRSFRGVCLTAHFFPIVVERFLRFDLSGGLAGFLGVLQLNVCAERFIDHFVGFLLRVLLIGHGLFDTDDLKALRALAQEMTGAIHFVFGPSHDTFVSLGVAMAFFLRLFSLAVSDQYA